MAYAFLKSVAVGALALVVFLKFFLPVFLLRYPFQASWLNFILDTVDGDILIRFGLSDSVYQLLDKAADFTTYLFMFLAGRSWQVGRIIAALFAWRTIGQALYFATQNELVFFFFPNFLEPFFMIYSLLLFINPQKAQWRYEKHLFLIWFIVVAYKMWNEWNTHLANIDLSETFFGF